MHVIAFSTSRAIILPRKFLIPQRTTLNNRKVTLRIGKRTLGVDYGLRRVGLAISVGIAPRAIQRVEHRKNPRNAAKQVASSAKSNLTEIIVVGMPIDLLGVEGEQAIATHAFIRELIVAAPWAKIWTLNETYTSAAAKDILCDMGIKGKDASLYMDSAAAVVLLERYFSDLDDFKPALVHEPKVVSSINFEPSAKGLTYAEWKRQAMERAAQHSNKTGKKRKKK